MSCDRDHRSARAAARMIFGDPSHQGRGSNVLWMSGGREGTPEDLPKTAHKDLACVTHPLNDAQLRV